MYYIGLMSGTSADGIDAALVDFSPDSKLHITATQHSPYPADILRDLVVLSEADKGDYPKIDELDQKLGKLYGDAVNHLLHYAGKNKSEIVAIGSHGHTVRHEPDAEKPFSLQIGNASTITDETGITTVADFRTGDIAVGGQGAPLVPAFHKAVFASDESNRCICNIGGIANVTYLPAVNSQPILGFDTGPGNTLMDHWIKQHKGLDFDASGEWAAQGHCDDALLAALMADPYFGQPPPKSTGKEYFNLKWVNSVANTAISGLEENNVQATLANLTATSISKAITDFLPDTQEIYVCGGGYRNNYLMALIGRQCAPIPVSTTSGLGIDPDWVEAAAFAWLAKQTLEGKPGNLPSVTGARSAVVLGEIYPV
ncbi:MAG: anhydro-N-acetylmuramic acid kinase [Acidiferrobacterales bacterium]